MNKTKIHILKTSLLLFLEKSYRDVTMKELVGSSGLSKGAFYHYFDSKEALFKEIALNFISYGSIDRNTLDFGSLKGFVESYIQVKTQAMAALNEMVDSHNHEKNSFNFFFIMFEAARRFPEFLEKEQEMSDAEKDLWIEAIELAKKNSEINNILPSTDFANLFLYSMDGVFIRSMSIQKSDFLTKEIRNVLFNIYNSFKIL